MRQQRAQQRYVIRKLVERSFVVSVVPSEGSGTEVEPYDPDIMSVGLEDFDPAHDAVMPTIRIDHKKGVFVDALSKEEFPTMRCVMLGLIKQRVLWEPEVEESPKGPLCKSYDFEVGFPDPKRFPWKASDFPEQTGEQGDIKLPCENCSLKDWGTHPGRDTPWCSEQHTFAVMQDVGNGNLVPALFTVQRSAIKPSKTYMTSFFRKKEALFTVWTEISLDHRKRGQVDFAVPEFKTVDKTEPGDFPMYARNFAEIREFVQTPRSTEVDEAPAESSPAPADAEAPPTAAAPPAASAGADDEDELPF